MPRFHKVQIDSVDDLVRWDKDVYTSISLRRVMGVEICSTDYPEVLGQPMPNKNATTIYESPKLLVNDF